MQRSKSGIDNTLSEELRSPTLTDYTAGAIMAVGLMRIWSMLLGTYSEFFSRVPERGLAVTTFFIYLLSGAAASYLVCTRASSKHLVVGLKVAALSWVFSLFLAFSATPAPTLGMVTALLVTLAAGGLAGAYLVLRVRLTPK
ncbi:MAG: hypothetical protein JSV18_04175 [Candidatus Bathyarchaeota archaeon]|nr:MAG: hypothetical protein JSV18_04175 [Candidatus Bathyarchaeota archaeon]